MKKYKKIITGLILALICAIMPFIATAKVKALNVNDILSFDDLQNTIWLKKQNITQPQEDFNILLYSPNIIGMYYIQETDTSYLLENVGNQSAMNFYSRYGSLPQLQNFYFAVRGTTVFDNYNSSSSGVIMFQTWETNTVTCNVDFAVFFSKFQLFFDLLEGEPEPVQYKINFNLNGGTSEQPADIEFDTSITINKNELPIPTRENYKFLYWAWADIDDIEYATPFTQEELTFTDTDIYMWAVWTLYDANMVFYLNDILIIDANLVFTELEQPEEISGEIIDKIAKIELIGDTVTTFKMIISTLSVNPMIESSSPYISYILNYTNHVEIGFNFNSEYLNHISATSLYNEDVWTNIDQDASFNDYLEIYINKPGQLVEVELQSAKLVNSEIDNINTGANAVFSIISNFLNINIGFLTVGSIIAVLLAVAVLGFIIKIWQGGNNG